MFDNIIKSIILGIVEGITEFLPISSTGHLILVNQWISFSEQFTTMFDIVIQLGAILAVVVYFWKRLWPFGKGQEQTKAATGIWFKAILGVIPAIILGALLGSIIEEKLFNPWVVAIALSAGGIILIFVEKYCPPHRFASVNEMPIKTVFYIGAIQCLSMIPGTSRSAATIIGAMLLGASRTTAVEFSFFLAIPTMVAASGYSLLKHGSSMTAAEFVILAAGFISAFFTALIVIKLFVGYIQRRDLKPFGYYRVALGTLIFIFFLLR
jgi:undecaprenyl-diphosphatase